MFKKFLMLTVFGFIASPVLATPEYESCYDAAQNDNQVALCMKAETARVLKNIQEAYSAVLKNEQTASWNNGNSLTSGNLKDMYDHWVAYRNRYCSLFVQASEHTFGSADYDKERCLLNLTNDHYELMRSVLINANTGEEEGDEE